MRRENRPRFQPAMPKPVLFGRETVQKRATFSGPLWPEGKCIQPIYVIEERRSLCTTQNEGALKIILAGFASARFRIVVCSKDFSAAHVPETTSQILGALF